MVTALDERRVYRLPHLDRTGFLGGLGIAEIIAIGATLSVCILVTQVTGWPTWMGLIPAALVFKVSRLVRPGGLHFAEYWPLLLQRAKTRWDDEWVATEEADLPPSLSGVEFVDLDRVRALPVHAVSGTQRPGAVLDRVSGHLSLLVRLDAPRFFMLSLEEQEMAVSSWANTLSTLTSSGEGDTYLSVETSVARSTAADHWDHLAANQAGDLTQETGLLSRSYRQLVDRHGSEARSSSVLLTFTLTLKARSRQGDWGTSLDSRSRATALAGLLSRGTHALGEIHRKLRSKGMTGHQVLNRQDLERLLAARVDPFSARGRSALHDRSLGVFLGTSLTTEPPRHIIRTTNYVVVNGVYHWTGWVNAWPLEPVEVDWGVRLFGEYEGELRSITYYQAVPRSQARQRHRSDTARHHADEVTALEKGKPVSLDTQQAIDEVDERGDDLRSGHQELEQVTLLTVSAPSPELLRSKVDTLLTWASNNGFGVYNLRGAQEAAWSHSLPFGVSPLKPRSRWD